MLTCAGLLKHRWSRLKLLKSEFNAKVLFSGCFGLSPAISSQCTLKMCATTKNCKNWEVQGRSRSSMLINLKSPSPVLVMISNMYVPICNRFYATWANNSEIITFRGYPSSTPACAGHFKLRESGFGLLKSTFNAENFVCRLFGFTSSCFGAIHS